MKPLREDLAAQRAFVRDREPIHAALLGELEALLDSDAGARLEAAWRGRSFGAWYERPLLLLAALRDDALREGALHPLFAALGAPAPEASAVTRDRVLRALAPDREHLWRILAERHVQTNEGTRAIAWLWLARMATLASPERPISLFDVGASAGLNLVADQLPRIWEIDGEWPALAPLSPIVERVGFDPRPLDPLDESDARWLRACVWPSQRDRLERLDAAVEVFRRLRAEGAAPTLTRAGAGEVPALLPRDSDRSFALVYQTVVRDYVPEDEWARYRAGMEQWLEDRGPGTAVWVELEMTPGAGKTAAPAAITAHFVLAGEVRELVLARCEPHPRRLDSDPAAVAVLADALRSARATAAGSSGDW